MAEPNFDPGPMLGTMQCVGGMQRVGACVSSRYFEDHSEFEDSVLAGQQHRRLAQRRYFQKPVWLALESSMRSSGTYSVSAISARCT